MQPIDTSTCHLGFRCIVRVNKETYLAGEKEKNLRDRVALRFDLLRTFEDPVVWGIVLLLLLRLIWAATINLSPQEWEDSQGQA